MHRYIILTVIACAVIAFFYSDRLGQDAVTPDESAAVSEPDISAPAGTTVVPDKAVLDITVHTIEELQVLFARADKLAQAPRSATGKSSVILVLHGPEVEFFSTRNYDRYKDIVDYAARLDALDIIDVKICQTMMATRGIARDDIPPFIEQVPDGSIEVERLVGEGYVYF